MVVSMPFDTTLLKEEGVILEPHINRDNTRTCLVLGATWQHVRWARLKSSIVGHSILVDPMSYYQSSDVHMLTQCVK